MLGTARTKPFSRSLSLVAAFALLAGTAAVAPAPAAAAGPATVALPAQFVGGYVEAWQSRTYPSNVPHANMTLIAFATTTSNRNVRMSYPMPRATLRASIATNTAAGKPTILSLGGAGGWHAPTSTTHVATMANDLIAIIEDYGFSGLDVNFEGGSAGFNEGNARFTASMMRRVHDHFTNRGQHFSLSIAPYGANPDGRANNTVARTYQEIMRQNVDIIDFVGFQYYNTGFPVSTTWVRNVLEHWKAEVPGMTNDQWALGFLRAHDWGGSTTPYPTMVGIWNDLKRSHPGVRGVWTWGVNEKETPTGYGFFTAFRPIINTTQPAPTQPAPTSSPVAVGDSSSGGRFVDVPAGVHRDAIERMAANGVIAGYSNDTFRPADRLTRGQLASLLDRAFELEAGPCASACAEVSDIGRSVHASAIEALLASGVGQGYPDGTYGPQRYVTRGQLATFLANVLELPGDPDGHTFADARGSTHSAAIGAITAAGIASGRTATSYEPDELVRRDQMASFLDRALDGA
jgi:hypothetical protein